MCVFNYCMFYIVVTINEGMIMLVVSACVLTLLYEKLKQVQYNTELIN